MTSVWACIANATIASDSLCQTEGRQRLIKIREDNFEDDVKSIAQYINDRKQRAIE